MSTSISHRDVLNGTERIPEKGGVRLRYVFPDGTDFTTTDIIPPDKIKGGVLISWCEAVSGTWDNRLKAKQEEMVARKQRARAGLPVDKPKVEAEPAEEVVAEAEYVEIEPVAATKVVDHEPAPRALPQRRQSRVNADTFVNEQLRLAEEAYEDAQEAHAAAFEALEQATVEVERWTLVWRALNPEEGEEAAAAAQESKSRAAKARQKRKAKDA